MRAALLAIAVLSGCTVHNVSVPELAVRLPPAEPLQLRGRVVMVDDDRNRTSTVGTIYGIPTRRYDVAIGELLYRGLEQVVAQTFAATADDEVIVEPYLLGLRTRSDDGERSLELETIIIVTRPGGWNGVVRRTERTPVGPSAGWWLAGDILAAAAVRTAGELFERTLAAFGVDLRAMLLVPLPPSAKSSADEGDLLRTVNHNFEPLRRCYGVPFDQTDHGKAIIQLRLSPEGRAYDLRLEAAEHYKSPVATCLLHALEQLQFPVFERSSEPLQFEIGF